MANQVIYETNGRAREYSELALNLYRGCGHRCLYCYAPQVTHTDIQDFEKRPYRRLGWLDIAGDAKKWAARGEKRRVLLCFTCDPYQPLEEKEEITREAIKNLHQRNLNVIILTKGGRRSMRDFDLLGPEDSYAATLTLHDSKHSLEWEPGAAPPIERIEALKAAYDQGIETWVSFEPVIYPDQTLELLEITRNFVGHYKVGPLNYHPWGKKIDWKQFGWNIKDRMDKLGVKYYFKRDLLEKMGVDPVERFPQTWKCF